MTKVKGGALPKAYIARGTFTDFYDLQMMYAFKYVALISSLFLELGAPLVYLIFFIDMLYIQYTGLLCFLSYLTNDKRDSNYTIGWWFYESVISRGFFEVIWWILFILSSKIPIIGAIFGFASFLIFVWID